MSIDWWTLGLQTANFLVLIWLLQRFLYRPVLAIIARRQAEIAGILGQADSAKAAAEKLEHDVMAQRAAIAAERDRVLEVARAGAERERQAALAKAQADADVLMAAARRTLEQERHDAAAAVEKNAATLGIDIARSLLVSFPPPTLGPFLDSLCNTIAGMRADERERLARSANSAAVRVVTAQPLPETERTHCRTRLTALLGRDTPLAFAEDPQLLAGVELHFPNSILRNTWRDALAAALESVTHDDQARRNA